MKKIIVGSIIVVILIATGVATYFYLKSWETISENGFSFSYPKGLILETSTAPGSNYISYDIKNMKTATINTSIITVSIPLADAGGTAPFSEQIKDIPYPVKIIPMTINGHNGEKIILRGDAAELRNNPPIRNTTTSIQLKTHYQTSPLLLFYSRADDDSSLDRVWEIIQQTLKY